MDRVLAVAAAAVVLAGLVVHGTEAIPTASYVNFVSGVWLTLADDLAHGVFYRDLIGPDGYGGTRYFPLFFIALAGPMRLGVPPLAAGFAASLAGGALLVLGIRRLLLRLGLPQALALALGLLVLAPRFVQQTLFEIRSDILAAGFVLWGLGSIRWDSEANPPRTRSLAAAAAWFVLAVMTKVTSLYAPAAAVVALAWSGHWKASARLLALVVGGTSAVLAIVTAASGGRALESWRACALAGAGAADLLQELPAAVVWHILTPSHAFSAVAALAAAAWVTMAWTRRPKLAVVLFPAAFATTAVVMAAPGTIFTNQLIDLLAIAIVLVGWAVAERPRTTRAAAAGLLLLALAASWQSVQPVVDGEHRRQARQRAEERVALVRELASLAGPVLSEAPELLVLGGVRPQVLDPFALRVVTLRRPDVLRDVLDKLESRHFSTVVLLFDPEEPRGRGWYTNLNFGWPVVSRVIAGYDLTSVKAGVRLYAPRQSASPPVPATH